MAQLTASMSQGRRVLAMGRWAPCLGKHLKPQALNPQVPITLSRTGDESLKK